MAISKNNVLTHGASGMLGGVIVFRNQNGKIIICNRPKKPTKQSPLQKENRTRFRRATAFAKQMMSDPLKKAEYLEIAKKLNLPNAYTAAITEYMRRPEVVEVDTVEYAGKAGQQIKIKASKKDFEIEMVEVVILDKEGNIFEKGKALRDRIDGWIYTANTTAAVIDTFRIKVTAWDRTGNSSEIVRST